LKAWKLTSQDSKSIWKGKETKLSHKAKLIKEGENGGQ
jgi:hypothetical protein